MSLSSVLKRHTVKVVESLEPVIVIPPLDQAALSALPVTSPDESQAEPEEVNVEAILRDAEERANQILSQASREANRLLEEANAQVDEIEQAAFQKGYREGSERAQEDARLQFQTWKDAEQLKLTQIAEGLTLDFERRVTALEPHIQECVTVAVERLLHRELQLSGVDVVALIDQLIRELIHANTVQIRVHPDRYDEVQGRHEEWQLLKPGAWNVHIVPDAKLGTEDCMVYTDTGRVDARLDTGLDEFKYAMKEMWAAQGEAASGTAP